MEIFTIIIILALVTAILNYMYKRVDNWLVKRKRERDPIFDERMWKIEQLDRLRKIHLDNTIPWEAKQKYIEFIRQQEYKK